MSGKAPGPGRVRELPWREPPDYFTAEDSDWLYYVRDHGNLDDSFSPIGYPDEFEYERVWMRPRQTSSVPPWERSEWMDEPIVRGPDGRFRPTYFWQECGEHAAGAVAYFGARYKREVT